MPQADPIDIRLGELEGKIERLRVLYDLYFQGMEKTEPAVARTAVERMVKEIQSLAIRNTGYRFRFNALVQRLTTYQAHWQRTLRQIEEGTYTRDLRRLERRRKQGKNTLGRLRALSSPEPAPAAEPPAEPPAPPSTAKPTPPTPPAEAMRPPTPAGTPPPPPPGALAARPAAARSPIGTPPATPATPPATVAAPSDRAPPPSSTPTEPELKGVYERLKAARAQTGEGPPPSYDKVAAALKQQADRLRRERPGARAVEFDVRIKNGKVVIQPVVRR